MQAPKIQAVMKAYAELFKLEWRDDISEWDDEIPTPSGGGAFEHGLVHEPPALYMTWEDVMDTGETGPWILMSFDDSQRPVTVEELERALLTGVPIHGVNEE